MNEKSTARHRDLPRTSARERIFAAAAELFYRRGIRAVGVETIAEQANTTKMSLYRNFPSKDELVAEWLRQYDADFWKQWDRMLAQHPADPRRQLRLLFTRLAGHIAEPQARGCPVANAAAEITDAEHPARKVIQAHTAQMRARLLSLCGELPVRHPGALADALLLLIEGAQTSVQSLGHAGPAATVVRAAETLIDAHLEQGTGAERSHAHRR